MLPNLSPTKFKKFSMKNLFTCCTQLTNAFGNCTGNIKVILMLLFFVATGNVVKAQNPPPACNIVGPLTACANHNPADTTHDFLIIIQVARATTSSTISYSFASNSSGAFIRKDLHGTIVGPANNTATGVTLAQCNPLVGVNYN
ncbi:MAG: hypothetical protein JWO06_3337, partial [Bacteroidota bacterium]|nr:hypothetical protein [Bacteroidota bacterium]